MNSTHKSTTFKCKAKTTKINNEVLKFTNQKQGTKVASARSTNKTL